MIDYQGNLTVQGNATMEGNVTLARAPDQDPFVPHLGFEVMKPPPVDAAPWQFYYTVAPVEPPAAAPAQPPPAVHQLRFEILDPDEQGEPTRHQFAIGAGDPHFAPFLTVRADGTVVMVGDVEVTGQVVEGPIQPDLTDPRFGSLLAESWVQGQGAGVSLSDVFNATQLTVQIDLDKTFSSTSIYQIRLTNSGSFDITNLKVYEVLTTNGQAYPVQEMSNEKLKALAPNTTVAIAVTSVATRRQLKLSQKTPFTLTVTAIGFGPGFLPQATASKQIEIDPTIEEPTP
jgi:archaellum component FlaF (FlaF/FlaG flagellin family)